MAQTYNIYGTILTAPQITLYKAGWDFTTLTPYFECFLTDNENDTTLTSERINIKTLPADWNEQKSIVDWVQTVIDANFREE